MSSHNNTGDVYGQSVQGTVHGGVINITGSTSDVTTGDVTSTEVRNVYFEGNATVHKGDNTDGIHQSF